MEDKCPKCGSKQTSGGNGVTFWKCGSVECSSGTPPFEQSKRCVENQLAAANARADQAEAWVVELVEVLRITESRDGSFILRNSAEENDYFCKWCYAHAPGKDGIHIEPFAHHEKCAGNMRRKALANASPSVDAMKLRVVDGFLQRISEIKGLHTGAPRFYKAACQAYAEYRERAGKGGE
jgi:hypothetical protein